MPERKKYPITYRILMNNVDCSRGDGSMIPYSDGFLELADPWGSGVRELPAEGEQVEVLLSDLFLFLGMELQSHEAYLAATFGDLDQDNPIEPLDALAGQDHGTGSDSEVPIITIFNYIRGLLAEREPPKVLTEKDGLYLIDPAVLDGTVESLKARIDERIAYVTPEQLLASVPLFSPQGDRVASARKVDPQQPYSPALKILRQRLTSIHGQGFTPAGEVSKLSVLGDIYATELGPIIDVHLGDINTSLREASEADLKDLPDALLSIAISAIRLYDIIAYRSA